MKTSPLQDMIDEVEKLYRKTGEQRKGVKMGMIENHVGKDTYTDTVRQVAVLKSWLAEVVGNHW